MVPFSFAGQEMHLVRGRALYWPHENALLVADLHLEKASFFVRHGQMIPPYDSRETLGQLAIALKETGAKRVYCLGDNFHDAKGVDRLEPYAAGMLSALTSATDWVWITGNHDGEADSRALGGTMVDELECAGLILRHQAHAGEHRPELSGHFHPKLNISSRGRRITRHCAVISEQRMILPAFGAFTGGMDAASAEIIAAMQPALAVDAIITAKGKLMQYPLWRAS